MAVQQLQHAHGTTVVPSDTLYLFQSLGYPYRVSSALFVGVGGSVRVLTEGGDDVVFSSVPDGTFMPVHVVKVFATGTTASSIVAVDLSNLSPFTGLLDTYSGAAAAYSLRQLSSSYSGSAIRVRRSSDNTEQDIGFASNELDVTALASFCSGTNGFVTTWYDQSGNGNNATQTTAANQPQIVSSGSFLGYIQMLTTGSNQVLTTALYYSVPTAYSVFSVYQNFGNGVIGATSASSHFFGVPESGSSSSSISSFTLQNYYQNGSIIGNTRNDLYNATINFALISSLVTKTDADYFVYLGYTSSAYNKNRFKEFIIYPNQTVSRTGVENNIITHYGL